jgi:hypothetical protein
MRQKSMPGLKPGGGKRINLNQVTNDKQCGIMHDKVAEGYLG